VTRQARLQAVLHPRSLVALGNAWPAPAAAGAGAGFGPRAAAAGAAADLDDWLDRVRRLAEECDALQARPPGPAGRWCRARSLITIAPAGGLASRKGARSVPVMLAAGLRCGLPLGAGRLGLACLQGLFT
jgi:hypothetical protein